MPRHFRFAGPIACLLLLLAAAGRPAAAADSSNALLDWVNEIYGEDAAQAAPNELLPPGWDIPVYLPAGGTLLVRGAAEAAAAGLAEEDDFQWALPADEASASAGTGRVYMINATHFALGLDPLPDDAWTRFDADFLAQMSQEAGVTVLGHESAVQLAGKRWLVYRLQQAGTEQAQPVDYLFALTLTPEHVFMLGLFCHAAPAGALDAGLRELLEAPAPPG